MYVYTIYACPPVLVFSLGLLLILPICAFSCPHVFGFARTFVCNFTACMIWFKGSQDPMQFFRQTYFGHRNTKPPIEVEASWSCQILHEGPRQSELCWVVTLKSYLSNILVNYKLTFGKILGLYRDYGKVEKLPTLPLVHCQSGILYHSLEGWPPAPAEPNLGFRV